MQVPISRLTTSDIFRFNGTKFAYFLHGVCRTHLIKIMTSDLYEKTDQFEAVIVKMILDNELKDEKNII